MSIDTLSKKVDRLIAQCSGIEQQQQQWLDMTLLTENEQTVYTAFWGALKQKLPVVDGITQLNMKLLSDEDLSTLKTWLELFIERAQQ